MPTAEQIHPQQRETLPTPEKIFLHEGLVGLQTRLMLGNQALYPQQDIAEVETQSLQGVHTSTYTLFEQRSRENRQAHWAGKGSFEEQKRKWNEKTVAALTSEKTQRFLASEKGTAHKTLLTKIGIPTEGFTTTHADTLYTSYFQQNTPAVELFVRRVIETADTKNGTIDYEYIKNVMPAIEWIGGLFGDNGKIQELLMQCTIAESKAQIPQQQTKLAQEANTQVQRTGEEKIRSNDLEQKEIELLTYLVGDTLPEALSTQPIPPEPAPVLQPEVPTPTPAPEHAGDIEEEQTEGDVMQQKIIEGRGFEVVKEVGWQEYREALKKVSYADIMAYQIQQIDQLKQQAATETQPTHDEIKQTNQEAKERMEELLSTYKQHIDSDPSLPYTYATSNKFSLRGKHAFSGQEEPLTRLYVGVATKHAPEAFKSLFEACRENGVIADIDVSLFTDSIYEDITLGIPIEDNSIIIYVPQQKIEAMQKVAEALQEAKQAHPEAWETTAAEKERVKHSLMYNFKIPLDDTIGFVEMPTKKSFDTTHRLEIGRELHPGYQQLIDGQLVVTLPTLHTQLQRYSPQQPGTFQSKYRGMEQRRKYMPALLFENEQLQTDWKHLEQESFLSLDPELWKNTEQIRSHVANSEVIQKGLPVYYPGAGSDITFPLAFTDATNFVFTDFIYVKADGSRDNNWDLERSISNIGGVITSIKQEGTLGQGGKEIITFDWGGKQRTITLYAEDATKFIPEELTEGSSFMFYKAPTNTARVGADFEDVPGALYTPESRGILLTTVVKGGFVPMHPTTVVPPPILGFREILKEPPVNPSQSRERRFPLYQKITEEPQLKELVQFDYDLSIALTIRNGDYTRELSADTLKNYETQLEKLKTEYEGLAPTKQQALIPILQKHLTSMLTADNQFVQEPESAVIEQKLAQYGLRTAQERIDYMKEAQAITKRIFPYLAE